MKKLDLTVAVKKTEAIILKDTIDETVIQSSQHLKYLRITLDALLTFRKRISGNHY